MEEIKHWNTIIDFLASRETVNGTYDLAILAGNSLPYLADELIRLKKQNITASVMLVGGVGHATHFLRENLKKIGITVSNKSEAEMYLEYFEEKFKLPKDSFLIEMESTNSGANAANALKVVKQAELNPEKVLLLQDPILQRRIKAAFEKEWAGTGTKFTNNVPRIPYIKAIQNSIIFEDDRLNGLWHKEYFISLVLGEIPRLRNDKNGYGPLGKSYIDVIEIPDEVEQAYEQLCINYPNDRYL
ncbi:ElyC/SanA/YdcF family protein [Enterococcus sp. 5H]|uniref:ElyC/SanA/YdcF family protein n=1 Tax=Enterococcus sp. 5H TaxID=1229490 RepID=UPI002304571D|nr:ElyC/SanA/YdcF family protein [Enterococcus sp. 5H]MDA9470094.1 Protein of unknown function DUF218 [Enterococcus sp. 5H]